MVDDLLLLARMMHYCLAGMHGEHSMLGSPIAVFVSCCATLQAEKEVADIRVSLLFELTSRSHYFARSSGSVPSRLGVCGRSALASLSWQAQLLTSYCSHDHLFHLYSLQALCQSV